MENNLIVTIHCLDCGIAPYRKYRWEGKPKPEQTAPACSNCGEEGMIYFVTCYDDNQVWISRKHPPSLEWFTPLLAAEEWGKKENTIHQHFKRGKYDSLFHRGYVRKSGSTWLIHRDALWELYGSPETNKKSKK